MTSHFALESRAWASVWGVLQLALRLCLLTQGITGLILAPHLSVIANANAVMPSPLAVLARPLHLGFDFFSCSLSPSSDREKKILLLKISCDSLLLISHL